MSTAEGGDIIAEAIRREVDARLKPTEQQAAKMLATLKEQADDRTRAFERETEALSHEANQVFRASKQRLDEIEAETQRRVREVVKEVTDSIQAKATATVFTVVGVVVAAVLGSAFLATKDVNSSVIGLQNTVIATQATIKQADKDLADQSTKLTAASNEVAKKMAELTMVEDKLKAANTQLGNAQSDLEKVRAQFQAAAKR